MADYVCTGIWGDNSRYCPNRAGYGWEKRGDKKPKCDACHAAYKKLMKANRAKTKERIAKKDMERRLAVLEEYILRELSKELNMNDETPS